MNFSDDGDPYGVLDFEGQFDSDDEEQVRREIFSSPDSGYPLGRWMDGLVDVFLRFEDLPESPAPRHRTDLEAGEAALSSDTNLRTSSPAPVKKDIVDSSGGTSDEPVEAPPIERPGGIWDDVAWFGRLVARTVRS